jgi:UDP-N-acetylglucosamine--N-acetylmuramyl-(pentapeptide) pyrophosphoryl-undecaprenol N-acetylglucosamine transferase
MLGRIADRVCLGFAEAARFFPEGRSVHTGNPVRAAVLAAPPVASATPGLLAFGGSQGARHLNDALLAAAEHLHLSTVRVRHQTGTADHDRVVAGWARLGVPARVDAFVTDMGGAYAEADVVVARAGAMSCAEVTARGLPAILVPYPHAADDHQRYNAEALVRAGAAMIIVDRELDGERLAAALASLFDDVDLRTRMASAARAAGRPQAAAHVADACASLFPRISP